MKTQNVYHFREHWSVRNPPVSLASWLMVITDDLEHSSKSLFPYDQYEIWKSIYAIAAITQNQRFNKFSVNAMIKYSSVVI